MEEARRSARAVPVICALAGGLTWVVRVVGQCRSTAYRELETAKQRRPLPRHAPRRNSAAPNEYECLSVCLSVCLSLTLLSPQVELVEKEIARRAVRIEPLGTDRTGAEYYVLPGDHRLFVRRSGNDWAAYTTNEELTALSLCGVCAEGAQESAETLPPLPAPNDERRRCAGVACEHTPQQARGGKTEPCTC